jgi:hypothetical protein
MKWIFTIRQKTKAALLLSAVFVFIFAKSWLDKRYVSELGSSFSAVYEDRLLAESYIYKLSDHLYQKKIMLDNCRSMETGSQLQGPFRQYNEAIRSLILDYEKTRLTANEDIFFLHLKNNLAEIRKLEAAFFKSRSLGQENDAIKMLMNKKYADATGNLHQLSGIQVSEGKLLNDKSKKIIAGANILTHFEMALLVGIGIIIQALIFATKSALPKIPHKPSLN